MATAESASSGPRYAPEDPTLPKPWKGLIDGTTGYLYYWNQETNVTKYERPVSAPPPLPQGPPPTTPKLAPIPVSRSQQSNDVLAQQGQQIGFQQEQQTGFQQGHQMGVQQGQQVGVPQGQHIGAQQGQQTGVSSTQQQQPGASSVNGEQAGGHQFQHMGFQQGHQFGFQQPQQYGFQTRQPMVQQQGQPMGFQPGQQYGLSSSSQLQQQSGVSSGSNQQGGAHPVQLQQMSPHHIHSQQMSSSVSMQQPAIDSIHPQTIQTQQYKSGFDSVHPQQHSGYRQQVVDTSAHPQQKSGFDSVHPQHSIHMQQRVDASMHRQQMGGPMVQMGPPMPHNQQVGGPPTGPKMNHEEEQHGRPGSEYFSNSHKDGSMMAPQQPRLAAIPLPRNHQGMRMDGVPVQNMPPGQGAGPPVAAGLPNMYNHGLGGPATPFSNNVPARPSPRIHGASELANVSVDSYRQEHEVTATGENVPAPFMSFEATGFPPEILREIQSAGFSSPTPIQAQTWPIALQNRDIVAIAKTGSGKTLGYLIPAFIHLKRSRNNPQVGPTVLVLAPTRELATQIQEEVIKFGRSSRLSCTCLYGGAPKGPQLKEIQRGADIVVATPGRLNDILEMRKINFHQVSFLVLDEADRMLDMGFEPQIRKIVAEIPPRRQTLMYTATWPKEVRKIAGDLLVNPVQVNIGSVDLSANKSITQHVEVVPQMEKQRRLEQILRAQEHGSKVIIFCSTKRLCDQLAHSIGRSFGAAAIHGDKSQGERDYVLNQFRSGKSPILVATDVAARGLDIKDIRVVINYDFPTGIEDYVHRIGRTGRAGATGVAYTFFCDQDWKYAADLVKVLEGANQRVPPEVRDMATRGGGFSKGRGGMNRWESGSRGDFSSRGDFGGRGGRDGFAGRSGRDGFAVRGGRDGFAGRSGRDGGRGDSFGGRGNRGRGFGGPGGPGRHGRGPYGRFDGVDGRGRYDGRRGGGRSRGRSFSPGPDKVRAWDRSRSRSRSWSRSRSRSRSRSWTRSRSRSRSYDRFARSPGRILPQQARPRSPYPVRSPHAPHPMGSGFTAAPPLQALPSGPAGPVSSVDNNFERPDVPAPGPVIEPGMESNLPPAGAL